MQEISDKKFEILLTIGAGDVTNFVTQIKQVFDN